jgi:hypothetical protein
LFKRKSLLNKFNAFPITNMWQVYTRPTSASDCFYIYSCLRILVCDPSTENQFLNFFGWAMQFIFESDNNFFRCAFSKFFYKFKILRLIWKLKFCPVDSTVEQIRWPVCWQLLGVNKQNSILRTLKFGSWVLRVKIC